MFHPLKFEDLLVIGTHYIFQIPNSVNASHMKHMDMQVLLSMFLQVLHILSHLKLAYVISKFFILTSITSSTFSLYLSGNCSEKVIKYLIWSLCFCLFFRCHLSRKYLYVSTRLINTSFIHERNLLQTTYVTFRNIYFYIRTEIGT